MIQWRMSQVLSLQIALITAFPLIALALISYLWVIPQIRADVESGHQDIAHAVAANLEGRLGGAEHELTSIANYLKGRLPRRAGTWQPLLDAHIGDSDIYESISIIDNRGITLEIGLPPKRQAERDTYLGVDISRKAFYRRSRGLHSRVWSNTYLSATSGDLAVAIAIPIDADFSLVAELSLSELSEISSHQSNNSHLSTMLIDRNAQLISHPDPNLTGQQLSLRNLNIVTQGLKDGLSTEEFRFQNQQLIGSSVVVPKLGWLVLVSQAKQHAYRFVWLATEAAIAACVLALLAALISGVLLARGLSRRIKHYSDNAHQLASGNYELRWPEIHVAEFTDLSRHLQAMAAAIQQRERELSNSEISLRATMEQTPNVAIQWFDDKGRVLYWNTASERLYKFDRDDVIGKDLNHLRYSQQQQLAFFRDQQALYQNGGTIGPKECEITCKDGSVVNVLSTLFLIPGLEDSPPRTAVMDIDLSELRLVERTLREREQRYRALIQQSPVAVIEWDLNGNVREWNESAEEIFGYPRELALGKPMMFIVPPEEQDRMEGVMATLLANIGGYRSEINNITASGRIITCQWYNQPIEDNKGDVIAIMSSIDDVSERKRMEAKLRSSEQKFISFFDSSPVAMSVSYFSNTPRFLNCNDAWCRLLGISRSSAIGHTSDDLGIWPDPIKRQQIAETLLAQGQVDDFEIEMMKQDGSIISCNISARVLQVGGEHLVLRSYQDITHKLQAQREIHELNQSLETRVLERTSELAQINEELQSALRSLELAQDELVRSEKLAALGSLVAGIAHELNTPIGNSLMAATTLEEHTRSLEQDFEQGSLKRSSLERFVDDARAGCTIVEHNLHKASELVSSFKQVAIDQTSSQRRQFKLHEVVNEIAVTLAPTLKKTPFELHCNIPDNLQLDSYPGPLGQILTNLINNSLLHGFDGRSQGRIEVTARAQGESQVELSVSDNGCGIAPDDIGKVFDPFFTSKLGKGGSGLGLNIVHNLTNQVLGGSIELDSQVGCGTRMILTLPLTAPISDVQEPGLPL
ncbi:PAS domain S-box protein [Motiliproteus coralliicola]|uniref:histidine kinase n=1 Tax=Motiliproteus coralliicola TaxID=2283196 RepID=A0A369WT25_9GAMM|nr:PAS domain S-box protein [Motiliproteus coralliicola]RDE24219.1 PAS domain S-box protein [Motiliproteus coralliicola]